MENLQGTVHVFVTITAVHSQLLPTPLRVEVTILNNPGDSSNVVKHISKLIILSVCNKPKG